MLIKIEPEDFTLKVESEWHGFEFSWYIQNGQKLLTDPKIFSNFANWKHLGFVIVLSFRRTLGVTNKLFSAFEIFTRKFRKYLVWMAFLCRVLTEKLADRSSKFAVCSFLFVSVLLEFWYVTLEFRPY